MTQEDIDLQLDVEWFNSSFLVYMCVCVYLFVRACVQVCMCMIVCVSIDQQQSIQWDATKEITSLLHPCLLLSPCDIGLSPLTNPPYGAFLFFTSFSFFVILFPFFLPSLKLWETLRWLGLFSVVLFIKYSSATAKNTTEENKVFFCLFFCISITCNSVC